MNIIQTIDAEQIGRLTEGKTIPDFGPGDTLRVNVKVVEGERSRIQAFEGVCIARSNRGINSSFTVRKISYGEGVERVFYVAPAFLPDEARAGVDFVAAAVTAGVRRFVFSSVIHPVLSALPNHAAKAPVEAAILDSGLEYTLLHPALFFQNYARAWQGVARSLVLAEPWSAETRFSRVDYRDVAEAAAIALTEDRLLYGTFELCAEGWLNRHDVAALASEVLGRRVCVERTDPDTLGDAAGPMRPMFAHYDHTGLRVNALTLRAILGREPRTLRAFSKR